MPHYYPEDRHQIKLMESLDDLVSKNNPVRIIDLIVDKMICENPGEFIRCKESNNGAPSYLTSTFLKLYLYGYFNGIISSRKLEKETYRNNEVIWLLGNLQPDFWVISNFRKDNGEIISKATKLFRKFLRSNEYMDFKTLVFDGTKVKANTRREMIKLSSIEKSLVDADKKIAEYLEMLKVNDISDECTEEQEQNGSRASMDMYLIDKIAELETKVKELTTYKQHMEESGLLRMCLADQEANLMKGRDGKLPCYNVQAAVDSKHHMIPCSEVTAEETDLHQLPQLTESLKEEYNELPNDILADRGYYNPDDIERIENQNQIQVYIPVPRNNNDGKKSKINFQYDASKDVYICPEGKELKLISRNIKIRNSFGNTYQCKECQGCPIKMECTSSKKGRIIKRYNNQEYRDRHVQKMSSLAGKKKSIQRKSIVEHTFGTIKMLMGKIPLLLRGKEKVSTEINLYTTAYNLKRLFNIESMDVLYSQIMAFNWK
jgi:transposase